MIITPLPGHVAGPNQSSANHCFLSCLTLLWPLQLPSFHISKPPPKTEEVISSLVLMICCSLEIFIGISLLFILKFRTKSVPYLTKSSQSSPGVPILFLCIVLMLKKRLTAEPGNPGSPGSPCREKKKQ